MLRYFDKLIRQALPRKVIDCDFLKKIKNSYADGLRIAPTITGRRSELESLEEKRVTYKKPGLQIKAGGFSEIICVFDNNKERVHNNQKHRLPNEVLHKNSFSGSSCQHKSLEMFSGFNRLNQLRLFRLVASPLVSSFQKQLFGANNLFGSEFRSTIGN